MANTIKIKNSQTTTNTPSSLTTGEIAINEQDELLFYRDGVGAVQSFDLTGLGVTVDNFEDSTDYTSGTTTQLTLSVTPLDESLIQVTFDGVVQHHDTYTLTADDVDFDAVIPLDTANVEIRTFGGGSGATGSVGGTRVLLATATASADVTVEFADGVSGVILDSTYDRYEFEFDGVTVSSNGPFRVRTSSDGGSTFDSGASDYHWTSAGRNSGGNIHVSSSAAGYFGFGSNVIMSATAGSSFSGTLALHNPSNSALKTTMSGLPVIYREDTLLIYGMVSTGLRASAGIVDGLQFSPNTGTISGEFRMYGVRK